MWGTYEDRDVYDGWILKFNPETKEIQWRDHWAVDKLSDSKKKQIELDVQMVNYPVI